VADQIADHVLRDGELAVAEQLDQECCQQGVVGGPDRDRGRGAQAGGEVRQADRPGCDRPPRGEQQVPAVLAQPVVELQERHLVGDRLRRIEHAGAQRLTHGQGRQGGPVELTGAGARRPDPGQVALAAARRPVHHERRSGPVGPTLQPGERVPIAGRRHEVLDPGGGLMLERQQQLPGHARDPGSGGRGAYSAGRGRPWSGSKTPPHTPGCGAAGAYSGLAR